MKKGLRLLAVAGLMVFSLSSFMPAKNVFTAAEQQQVSIATPGLFAQSQAFNVDFEIFRAKEYSFPLPVGKAILLNNNVLRISTSKGDAVKAMLEGYVRLSRKSESMGNVIVVRHDCGLETVYANNAENLVKVGQHVDAGQTIAIVGSKEGETYCDFSIMVNGGRLNPETFVELKSHKLRRQTVQFRKQGARVIVSVIGGKDSSVGRNAEAGKEASGKKKGGIGDGMTLDPDEVHDPFTITNTFELDLEKIEKTAWAYPLPGAKVISPYGGKRRHSGVDLKTCPNDEIVAAFDGTVVASGPYYGYGNCIRIKHAYGFETLYSHQSRNRRSDNIIGRYVNGIYLTAQEAFRYLLHIIHRIHCQFHHINAQGLAVFLQMLSLHHRIDFTGIINNTDFLDIGLNFLNQLHLLIYRSPVIGAGYVAVRCLLRLHELCIFKIGNSSADNGNLIGSIGHGLGRRCRNSTDELVIAGHITIGNSLQIGLVTLGILLIDFHLILQPRFIQSIHKPFIRLIQCRVLHNLDNAHLHFTTGTAASTSASTAATCQNTCCHKAA